MTVLMCSVDECERATHCKGFCKKHYTRLLRHGSPLIVKKTGLPLGAGHTSNPFPKGHRYSTRHGYTGTSTHNIWLSMVARCSNPRSKDWPNYGGRGITVCKRWLTFENFLADMGERPEGLSIDRIDNERGYEAGNCRWASRSEQGQNRRPYRWMRNRELAVT